MAKPFQFAFLLALAIEKREEAARLISVALSRQQQMQERLNQVEQYREEYRLRLTDTATRGMRVHQWNDFQLFLAKLDTAVEQQVMELQRSDAQVEAAKQAWLEREKEVKAFETLHERHNAREGRREGKREQNLSDESASNIHRRGSQQ
ncbi:flagellar export protein FliJ [Chitinimonas sp. BJB300]|uniref:flagellar export protein FliJ n=1 Tax=Chitinimonas sp. BJB300 TaxID=1559339 RepID=UPI000C0EFB3E|nr:flagellar export protein FliJ [Chitinimonas sp. BJB300]PHV13092.1 flagellar export protein FliJ [Chitinimonas sp. BJB300]TSJ84689.1 flagellar export protein FliJ [Chitinimonas sp. BJB300]